MSFQTLSDSLGNWCRRALRCLHRFFWGCVWPSGGKFFFSFAVCRRLPWFCLGCRRVWVSIVGFLRVLDRVTFSRISLIEGIYFWASSKNTFYWGWRICFRIIFVEDTEGFSLTLLVLLHIVACLGSPVEVYNVSEVMMRFVDSVWF